MLKKIFISLGVVMVAALLAFGTLFLIKQAQPQQEPVQSETDKPKTVVDLSKDYGACTQLGRDLIILALGDVASNVQNAQNAGIVGDAAVGEGVDDIVSDSQVCVYAFESGGTLENGFNSNNALIVQKTRYSNDNGPASFIAQIRTDELVTELESIGDVAFYSSNTASQGPGAVYNFKLQVFIDNELTEYSIHQPADVATFTADTAQAALVALVQKAE